MKRWHSFIREQRGNVLVTVVFLIIIVGSGGGGGGHSGGAGPASSQGATRSGGGSDHARTTKRSYTVKTGDTLGGIATKTGVPVDKLLELNPQLDPQALVSGQRTCDSILRGDRAVGHRYRSPLQSMFDASWTTGPFAPSSRSMNVSALE